jgi:hypothetical protein
MRSKRRVLTRRNVTFVFLFVEAALVVSALVFGVPEHKLKSPSIAIAILYLPAIILVGGKNKK